MTGLAVRFGCLWAPGGSNPVLDEAIQDALLPTAHGAGSEWCFLVYGFAEAISVHAVNAKGASPCTTIMAPDAAPTLEIKSTAWMCPHNENVYCFERVGITVTGQTGYQVEYEQRGTPGNASTQIFSGTLPFSSDHEVDVPLDERLWIHARQREDANSSWSGWSSTLRESSPATEAVQSGVAVVPRSPSQVRLTRAGNQYRLSFSRGWHGGLPITHYEWAFTGNCGGSDFPAGRLTPADDDINQSFLLESTGGTAFSLRGVNVKGVGWCKTVSDFD